MLYRILTVAPTRLRQSQMSRRIGKKSDIRCEHTTLYDDIIILLTYNIITTPERCDSIDIIIIILTSYSAVQMKIKPVET